MRYRLQGRHVWSPLIDAAVGGVCYLLAYLLHFSGPVLQSLWPTALNTVWIVALVQTTALGLFGAYRPRSITVKTIRLALGAGVGIGAAAGVVFLSRGFDGVSRAAFAIQGVLFFVTAVAWRAVRALWSEGRARRAFDAASPQLVDRAAEPPSLIPTILSLIAYRELLRNLVMKDLKLKYRGSVLGFLWSLLNPLMMVVIYTVVFTYIIPNPRPRFAFFFMLGLLAWTFFANSVSMATGAIIESAGLMKAVRFPRAILPLATVVFNLVQYLLMVVVLLPVMFVVYGTLPSWPVVLFPVFLALQVAFTVGIALMLATATTFFRDIRHLVDISLSMLFWLTPIVYPLSGVPESIRFAASLSPMSPYVGAYHQIFYDGQWPDLSVWVVGVAYAVSALTLGAAAFLSLEDRFVEQL